MKKKYPHIDLPPDLQAFRDRFTAATEVEGTLGGIITCYRMHGRYFARTKSSLTGQQVKKDHRFQRTMHNAGILALAARYVTPIYRELTEDWRCHDLYRKLVGLAIKLLHNGWYKEQIQQAVYTELEKMGYRTEWPVWQLPPNLQQWKEEELLVRKRSFPGVASASPGIGRLKPRVRNSKTVLQHRIFVHRDPSAATVLSFVVNKRNRPAPVGRSPTYAPKAYQPQ